jgi:para-nitrobenzyl esterase
LGARWGNPEITPADKKLAEIMNTYWTNFAKTGNPNGEGLPQWPAYTPKNNQILEIQPNGVPLGKPDPRKKRLDLIDKSFKIRGKLQNRGI